tara:strand:- start:1149 stop:1520 length:372 start_codon:yes stop_codon:yes gene_type:complete
MQNNFDIDLDFGQIYEKKIKNMLEGKGRIEVKTERDIWKKTGNIVIEILYKGRPSGLSITNADWWIHILSYNGKIDLAFIFSVCKLKRKIKKLVAKKEARIVMGGDNKDSKLVLVPINKILQI